MNSFLSNWFSSRRVRAPRHPRRRTIRGIESLETRSLLAADPLPVLLVIADQRDFYYTEYAETREAIEAEGVEVQVAATSTSPSLAHAGSGQGSGDGIVVPDLSLASVNEDDYSAIVFVGGWGSSMYQYDFPGTYQDGHYNGDLATRQLVNDLINEFVADDKYVAAICHGTTVLAWARVDGVSPLAGKQVSVPYIGSPAVEYNGVWYGNFALGQYEQAVSNGAIANTFSGQYGRPDTVADDVVVDGRIITAENYDAAAYFGYRIAQEVIEAAEEVPADPPPVYVPVPGTVSWFSGDLMVQGTSAADTIYIWSGSAANQVFVWMNGVSHGAHTIAPGGHVKVFGGEGNDQIYASDARYAVEIHGEAGHDLITGGLADDLLLGGDGVDRLWGGPGDDFISGGAGQDLLFGREGNDVLVGGDGNDYLEGFSGRDLLIGGLGSDRVHGGDGEDLLIGGSTTYDNQVHDLLSIHDAWVASRDEASGQPVTFTAIVQAADDACDTLIGGGGADQISAALADAVYSDDLDLLLMI
jgi:putative intracellular protease/amidase